MFAHFVVSWTLLGSIADVQQEPHNDQEIVVVPLLTDVQREPHNDQEIVVVPLLTDVQREPHNDQEIVVVPLLTALCEHLIRILEKSSTTKSLSNNLLLKGTLMLLLLKCILLHEKISNHKLRHRNLWIHDFPQFLKPQSTRSILGNHC